MNKSAFILALADRLSGLPREEVKERLEFYVEMIEDRVEDGLSEEEAVASVGSVDEIAAQIVADIPLVKIAKERVKNTRRLTGGEILLLILGFPLWFPLGVTAFSVILSVYLSLWAAVISLWAGFVSLAACALAGVVSCGVLAIVGHGYAGLAMLAGGFVCAGVSVLWFLGCKAATRGMAVLTGKMAAGIKRCFIKKERVS